MMQGAMGALQVGTAFLVGAAGLATFASVTTLRAR
jgi:hypothetical protein